MNPHHKIAFQEFFKKHEIYPTEKEFEDHMYGKNNQYIMSHFLDRPIQGQELDILADEKESLFRELYKDKVETLAGYLDFLTLLKDSNIQLGDATSAPAANRIMILQQLGIENYFSSLLASEDVTHHKPDPEVYLQSAKNLGVEPSECLIFEDSASGVQAEINAGIGVIGVLSTYTAQQLPPCLTHITNYRDAKMDLVKDLIF
ncbi:HAD family hydrolase [Membranihabitans marinus]|uniref:HAD family hydrolase n=1 Tax=Membranihabitans marinus TaxID=1227546 RepID=UPI00293E9CC2|nr:HAD family phosphatase [Membranihabitans marinus]